MIFKLKNKKGAFVARVELNSVANIKSKNVEVIVLAGSRMYKEVKKTKKWNDCPWIDRSRREILSSNEVLDKGDYYELLKDVSFSSPNRAACAMLGYITTKAWHEFINDEGLSMHEVFRINHK
jgi:hypothetical protein